jgi:hypothetical protein
MRIALKIILVLVLLLSAAGGVLYLLASAVPEAYRPAVLSREQQEQAAKAFINGVLSELHNRAEDARPFEMTFTQGEINSYLASADEIIRFYDSQKVGEARRSMAEAGIAAPAVALDDGVLTFMCRLTEYDKILSVDLAFAFDETGKLKVSVAGARLGRLPAPGFLVRRAVDEMTRRLPQAEEADAAGPREGAPTSEDVGRALRAVAGGIGGDNVPTVFGFRRQKRIRLVDVAIEPGGITLRFEPHPAD